MEESFNKVKISMILNYIIFVFTMFATVAMFTGIKFMSGVEAALEKPSFGMLRLFTVQANIFMGITSLIMALKERRLLLGKIKLIPTKYYVLKLVSTVSVALTFLVVFTYLAPLAPGGIMILLQNSNLFFHLVIPILSIITFCFFEVTNSIKFKYTFYSLLPTFIYAIYYIINILIHVENGSVRKKYDWYLFVQGGLNKAFIVAPVIFLITYVIGVILWIINKKNKK